MKTILVPVDLSAVATSVCDTACELARVMKARILLLHVVQPPPVMVMEIYALGAAQAEDMMKAAEDAGADRVRELAERCRKRGIPVRTAHRVGVPVIEILERAAKAHYIVMGSHGHSALGSLVLGSVTSRVLANCSTPVLIVR